MYTRSTPSLYSAYMMIICIVILEIKDQSISSGRYSTFRFRSHMVVNPKDRVFLRDSNTASILMAQDYLHSARLQFIYSGMKGLLFGIEIRRKILNNFLNIIV